MNRPVRSLVADGMPVGYLESWLGNEPDRFAAYFDALSTADRSLCLQHPVISEWNDNRRIAAQNAAASTARVGVASADQIDVAARGIARDHARSP